MSDKPSSIGSLAGAGIFTVIAAFLTGWFNKINNKVANKVALEHLDNEQIELNLRREELARQEAKDWFDQMKQSLEARIESLEETVKLLTTRTEAQKAEIDNLKKSKLAEQRLRRRQVSDRDKEIAGLKLIIEGQSQQITELRNILDIRTSPTH